MQIHRTGQLLEDLRSQGFQSTCNVNGAVADCLVNAGTWCLNRMGFKSRTFV